MAVAPGTKSPETPSRQGPGERRALAGGAWEMLRGFLTLREGSVIVVTAIALIYFGASTTNFFSGSNFKNLLPYFAPYAIIAAGEVFVMILGEIDLSIGATYLFAPIVFYKLNTAGIGLVPSVVLALLCCMAVGLINSVFNAVIGVSSFVVTLG